MMGTKQQLAQAEKIAAQIMAKIDLALEPLQREMTIMDWAPAYRNIVWEKLAREALARMSP